MDFTQANFKTFSQTCNTGTYLESFNSISLTPIEYKVGDPENTEVLPKILTPSGIDCDFEFDIQIKKTSDLAYPNELPSYITYFSQANAGLGSSISLRVGPTADSDAANSYDIRIKA